MVPEHKSVNNIFVTVFGMEGFYSPSLGLHQPKIIYLSTLN